jgi:large subunit ribosomal protein L17
MRHGIAHNHFNRDSKGRKSLFKNLVIELIEHGSMTTTKPRAKEIRRIADTLIHKAQTDTLTVRRTLHRFFGRRDVVNTLVERIAPAVTATGRVSGFTTMTAAGTRRGDNSEVVTLSLVAQPEKVGTLKSGRDLTALQAVTKTKKVSKPAVKAEPASAEAAQVTEATVAKKAAAPKKAAAKKPVVKKTVTKKAAK